VAWLERFLHDERQPYPTLVKAALAHVQFETIHPFLDGNGRLGRLLISFILHHDGMLSRPLLYLSLYFKQHRSFYYELLDQVRRTGDWERWIDFFLGGVEKTAEDAVETARRLVSLFREDENRIQALGRRSGTLLHCFQAFCRRPIQTIKDVSDVAGVSYPTAANSVATLEELGVLRELTGKRRDRIYAYDSYLNLLDAGAEPL
jgi:Fic family protein